MSYDLWVEYPDNQAEAEYLRHDNFTSNIDALLRASKWVGLTLKHLDGLQVWDAAMVLDDIYLEWGERPTYFASLANPEWGNYIDCRSWVSALVNELYRLPEQARLRVHA